MMLMGTLNVTAAVAEVPNTVPVQYYRVGTGGGSYNNYPATSKMFSTEDLQTYYNNGPLSMVDGNGTWWNIFHWPRGNPNGFSMADGVFFNTGVYNDAFFETHFLLFAVIVEGSGSIRHRADSLVIEDDGLTLNITSIHPAVGTADVAMWHIVYELPLTWKDLPVSVNRNREPLSAGGIIQPPTASVISGEAVQIKTPITSIKIDAVPIVTVSRYSAHSFDLALNAGASGEGVIWSASDPSLATVDNSGNVNVLDKTGNVRLTATDPVSGLSHSVTLRIAS